MASKELMSLILVFAIAVSAYAYNFNDILVEYWAGNGSNESVVVIDFGIESFTFGYRWDGTKYGKDLMDTIAAAGPLDYNDSAGFLNTISYGSYSNIGQVGWPADWWSYFISTDGENWVDAGEGFATRVLTDGSWDGWAHQTTGDWPAIHLPTTPFLSDFASKIISYHGPFGISPYDDPNAVLGRPATYVYDDWNDAIYACSLVYTAWNTAPDSSKLIVTLDAGAEIVVGFDHKVADDPCNPYGIDFIVFGNSGFEYDFESYGFVEPNSNMDEFFLVDPTSIYSERVTVSVAQDPNGPWYTFTNGPYADADFPTNAFQWDSDSNDWGDELDWLKPVDPNLSVSDFDGLSVAAAIELYNGSAGGTGFDLQWLEPNDYHALAIDPETGQRWIQYIKVTSDEFGEVDGFADVACCGDYKHPYPTDDISKDCRVDMEDLAIVAEHRLECIWNCK
jgi:hypothetical protein